MARNNWTRQDIDDRLGDARQQLQECRTDGMREDGPEISNIKHSIDWHLDKRNRTDG